MSVQRQIEGSMKAFPVICALEDSSFDGDGEGITGKCLVPPGQM